MPDCQPVDESYFDTAPYVYRYPITVPVPPSQVWDGLTADRPLSWVRGLNAHWTSPRPYGLGSTRDVHVFGAMRIKENFFVWSSDEGAGRHRYAFHATSTNLPAFTSFAEDYVVEPADPAHESTTFTWTFALTPAPFAARPMKLGAGANEKLFAYMANSTRRHFSAR